MSEPGVDQAAKQAMPGSEVERLIEEAAIIRCLYQYARSVDRLDLEGVRNCYTADAHDNHGGYSGGLPGLIEDIDQRHRTIDSSQHFISNVLVDFHAGGARVESYCLCYLRSSSQDHQGMQSMTVIRCRYLDWFVRTDDGWKIQDRVVAFDERVETMVRDTAEPGWVLSIHGPDATVPDSWKTDNSA